MQISKTGGLGGVLVNEAGECVSWFGFVVDKETCKTLEACLEDTMIHELELIAGILSSHFWSKDSNVVW